MNARRCRVYEMMKRILLGAIDRERWRGKGGRQAEAHPEPMWRDGSTNI